MPAVLVVEADLREPPVADNYLGHGAHVSVKGLDVLVDGRGVVGFGAGEVERKGVDIALHQLGYGIIYDSGLTYSIGSKKYDGDRFGHAGILRSCTTHIIS